MLFMDGTAGKMLIVYVISDRARELSPKMRWRLQILGGGLMVMMVIFDSSVIGLLPPDLELARRPCFRGHVCGAAPYCGTKLSRIHSRAGRLCLRGGADDGGREKDTMRGPVRGSKRPRRPQDGPFDADYVETLHSSMARADAARLMHVRHSDICRFLSRNYNKSLR